ncbi:hypothetical protein RF11_09849 [Thelohanellus kitauei]|uniref:Uncharacterized protein n=1 Tax=Thelohanellus kitauei TaxID=669202 RepID=A0A0C2N7S4_THEKT|nr:hypothetical protein RF11_09849 [Thelohanellus kitauei]
MQTFFQVQFTDVYLNFSELVIKIKESTNSSAFMLLKCHIFDSITEIEINQCNVNIQTKSTKPIHNIVVGYQFKFNKRTKYDIGQHYMMFAVDQVKINYAIITIENISIQTKCFDKKCAIIQKNITELLQVNSFENNQIIYPCESIGGNIIPLRDTCGQVKNKTTIVSDPDEKRSKNTLIFRVIPFIIIPFLIIPQITNFYHKGSELIVDKPQQHRDSTLFGLKCNTNNSETEIEIKQYDLTIQTATDKPIHKIPVGYTFKFNKYIIYDIGNYVLKVKSDGVNIREATLEFYKITIKTPYSDRKCVMMTKDDGDFIEDIIFPTNKIIYPCITIDGTYSSLKDNSVLSTTGENILPNLEHQNLKNQYKYWIILLVAIPLFFLLVSSLHQPLSKNVKHDKVTYQHLIDSE